MLFLILSILAQSEVNNISLDNNSPQSYILIEPIRKTLDVFDSTPENYICSFMRSRRMNFKLCYYPQQITINNNSISFFSDKCTSTNFDQCRKVRFVSFNDHYENISIYKSDNCIKKIIFRSFLWIKKFVHSH